MTNKIIKIVLHNSVITLTINILETIMNKIIAILAALSLSAVSFSVFAAPNDAPPAEIQDAPPAQIQKDHVPDSTSNGNYLEPQPDESGASKATQEKDSHSKKTKEGHKNSKPTPAVRGKQTTEEPAEGGIKLDQKK